ncbi:MAG: DUF3299 domain-containing protein [Desulfovibrio sp.]|nr:DUF3299 domain-containing protein [Desulfovibrio sp.]
MQSFLKLLPLLLWLFFCLPGQLHAEPKCLSWSFLLPEDPQLAAQGLVKKELDGQEIALQGFVVPLERDADNKLSEFLLVPYFGACIHVPPPPANQIVYVRLSSACDGVESMDLATVRGRLRVDSEQGLAGYELEGAVLMQEKAEAGRELKAWLLTLLCGISVSLGWIGPLAGRRLSARLTCLGMSVAAGMLMGLGLSALLANISLEAFCAFTGLFLLVVLLLRKRHEKQGQSDLVVALGLALHNYPECFLVLTLSLANGPMGLALAMAMLAHNVPVGLSLAMGLPQSARAWSCAFLAGILPPLLAIATHSFVRAYVSPDGMRLLMSAAGGVLLALSLRELLPHALASGERRQVVLGVVLGLFLLFVIVLSFYLGLF